MNFETVQLSGKYGKTIGEEVEFPFHMMIYGKGGGGKSTYSIGFAAYLSKSLIKKVLYIADEEKLSFKLKEKFDRLNANNRNLDIIPTFNETMFGKYDFVFIDSVTSTGIDPDKLKKLKELYPTTSFILVFQTTKEGNFRGSKEWEHEVDVVVKFENGMATVEKSRFGAKGLTKIW